LEFGDVMLARRLWPVELGNYSNFSYFRTNPAQVAKSTLLRIRKLKEDI
jgi:hypothetical protein